MTTSDREHDGWELLPCPFCGSGAKFHPFRPYEADNRVECETCPGVMIGVTREQAIAAWNSRSPVLGGGGEAQQDQEVMASVAQSAAGSASHDAAGETACQSEGGAS